MHVLCKTVDTVKIQPFIKYCHGLDREIQNGDTIARVSSSKWQRSPTNVFVEWRLSDSLHLMADLPGRSRLRTASTLELVVPLTRLSTVGDRSFPVAAAEI
jgi:hypothetical protein